MEQSSCVNQTTFVSDGHVTSDLNLLVAAGVFLTVVTTFTLLANIVVVIGVIKSLTDNENSRNVNKITQMLMSSMGVTDALFGAVIMPLSIVEILNNGHWYLGHVSCSVRLSINNTLSGISIYHIFLMALDKYVSICRPLQYRTLSTNIVYVIIGVAWIFPAVFINIPLSMRWGKIGVEESESCYEQVRLCLTAASPRVLLGIFCLAFYVPLSLTYMLYLIVLYDIYRFNQRKKHFKNALKPVPCDHESMIKNFFKRLPKAKFSDVLTEVRPVCQGTNKVTTPVVPQVSLAVKSLGSRIRNLKAFRTIGLIVLCFNLCWFPTSICVIYFAHHPNIMPLWVVMLLNWSCYLNATLNPILYCSSRTVRRSVKALIWRS